MSELSKLSEKLDLQIESICYTNGNLKTGTIQPVCNLLKKYIEKMKDDISLDMSDIEAEIKSDIRSDIEDIENQIDKITNNYLDIKNQIDEIDDILTSNAEFSTKLKNDFEKYKEENKNNSQSVDSLLNITENLASSNNSLNQIAEHTKYALDKLTNDLIQTDSLLKEQIKINSKLTNEIEYLNIEMDSNLNFNLILHVLCCLFSIFLVAYFPR